MSVFIKQHVRYCTAEQEWVDAPSLLLKALILNHYFLIMEMQWVPPHLALFIYPSNNNSCHLLSAYNMPGTLL